MFKKKIRCFYEIIFKIKQSVCKKKSIFIKNDFLGKIVHVIAPCLSILVLVATVKYWNSLNYALALECNGQEIAKVSDEKVLEEANVKVNSKLTSGNGYESNLSVSQSYKLVIDDSDSDTSEVVAEKIIEQSKDAVEEGIGIYINNSLIGVVKNSDKIEMTLAEILSGEVSDENRDVHFNKDIEYVSGLYSIESFVSEEDILSVLLTPIQSEEFYVIEENDALLSICEAFELTLQELQDLNPGDLNELMYPGKQIKVKSSKPYLSVVVECEESYEKEIDFKKLEIDDDSEYTDYKKVTQEGEKGLESCVDKVCYVDGKEALRVSVSRNVIKEPVDENIVIGTKKKVQVNSLEYTTEGTGKSTGSLLWPVACSSYVSSPYGPRNGRMHTGIDIAGSGINGKSILAADGGIVVTVGNSSGGYGKYIEIKHNNGTSTLYAHCSSVYVASGMKVSKGQPIGAVGSTGNSTGPHLHFEVIDSGVQRDPMFYV